MAEALGFVFRPEQGIALTLRLSNVKSSVACNDAGRSLARRARGDAGLRRAEGRAEAFAFFETRMRAFADLVTSALGVDRRNEPRGGCRLGGLGLGLMSFCQARLVSGFDFVADITQLEARMAEADLVITGEGKVDGQTLHGKGPSRRGRDGAAAWPARHRCSQAWSKSSPAVHARFDRALSVKPEAMPLAEAIQRGEELIEETVAQHAAQFRELVLSSKAVVLLSPVRARKKWVWARIWPRPFRP